jgi:hypothetical protein
MFNGQIMAINYPESEKESWTEADHAYHKKICEEQIYGAGFKRDKSGKPIEQGIGSSGNMTPNAIEALKRSGALTGELKAKLGL